SDKEKRGMVIYILRVKVREDWQNKKVGTMMLPRALKNVSTGQDNAVATSFGVHLRVEGTNDHAIKLYEKFNFTYVGGIEARLDDYHTSATTRMGIACVALFVQEQLCGGMG
ncbi:hypothetical protein FOZ62_018237, partial [Perkinsus olseni]